MAENQPGQDHLRWVNQVKEEPLEPALPICDPHHHLWLDSGHTGWPYTVDDLLADTAAGHNIVQTVYLECGAEYRKDGPRHLRPVGETEFVIEQAERTSALAAEQGTGAVIAGIQGNADMTLGDAVEEVLLAHEEAGRGRFRGVRYITAQDAHPPLAMGASAAMDDPQYLAGVKKVGAMGYTYDAMAYHPQLRIWRRWLGPVATPRSSSITWAGSSEPGRTRTAGRDRRNLETVDERTGGV